MINSQSSGRTRVLFVITKSVWGGAQKYVYDLATSLPREEFDVAVALGGSGTLAQKLKEKNVEVFTIKNFQYSVNVFKDIGAFLELRAVFNHWKPDVVHSNSSKAGGLAGAAAFFYRTSRKPTIIFTAHGWAFHEPRSVLSLLFLRLASRLTSYLQSKIICVTNYDKESALSSNIASRQKMTVIPNGVNPIEFLPRDQAQIQLLGHTEIILIGCVAEWTLNKGLAFLLKAFNRVHSEFPDAKLCLVGWGDNEGALRSYITTLGLENMIYMVHASPAAPLMQAFDILVLPSLKEGLPYTLLEGGLGALPMVATRVGGVPEILQNNESGILVPPASENELADAILMLLKDPKLSIQIGEKARLRVQEHFMFNMMLRRTMELYR